MKLRNIYVAAFAAISFLVLHCKGIDEQPTNLYQTNKTTDYSGKLAHDWIALGHQCIKENNLSGPHAARAFGYLGLTLWESLYNGIPGANSMAGQINDYPRAVRINEIKIYDWSIVMCNAMRVVFPEVIDQMTEAQRNTVFQLAERQEDETSPRITDRTIFDISKDLGISIGQAIVARARKDGRDIIRNIVPQLPIRDAAHPWYWDRATYDQNPVEPMWGTLRTFVIAHSQVCEAEEPTPYSTASGSTFYKEAEEIYQIPRSDQNKKLAYHFENGPGRTSSPAGHWMSIAEQFLTKDDRDLAFCAKVYCLAGFAVADAYSSAWYIKYKYNMLRPATYIKEQFNANWEPILSTPPHPDYASASAILGGALPVVLVSVLEDRTFVDRTHLGSPLYTPEGGPFLLPERQFESITHCGEQMAESRIVGGVHFRRSCEEGLNSGRCIGNFIVNNLDFGF
jgi:hypothetical protein